MRLPWLRIVAINWNFQLDLGEVVEFPVSSPELGVDLQGTGRVVGIVSMITTSTATKRDHVSEKHRIPFSDGDGNNDYDRNIQIADLNAALAVIKWKKLIGFYQDRDREYYSTYTIDGNMLLNEDSA